MFNSKFDPIQYTKQTRSFCLQEREDELDKLIPFSKYRQSVSQYVIHFFNNKKPQHKYKKLIDELPFLTFSEYMQFVMFEEQQGYYSSGKVKFGNDFATNATRNSGLAFVNLLDMFKQWIDSGQPEKFYNYEGGAGNGKLAFDTLSFAEELAQINLKNGEFDLIWSKFYKALQYVIVELSPALVKRQSELCQKYIDKKKLEILNANVIDFKPPTKIHRYCSNELIDDLPLEGFTKNQQGQILTITKLPAIPKKSLLKYPQININESEIKRQDEYYRKALKNIADISKIPSDSYIVNKKFFSQLSPKLKSRCRHHDVYLPLQYFERSYSVLKENLYVLPDIEFGKITYVCADLNKFAKAIQSADRVLFFDYGGVDDQISSDVRYFYNSNKKSGYDMLMDIFFGTTLKSHFVTSPSTLPRETFVNITHDVDFYAVMRTFNEVGFKVELYGHQSIILNKLDEKFLTQALSMLTKKFEQDNSFVVNGLSLVESDQPLFYDLRHFSYRRPSCRFILLEKQTTLAEDYYPLPDLKFNSNFWHTYEKQLLCKTKQKNSDDSLALVLRNP